MIKNAKEVREKAIKVKEKKDVELYEKLIKRIEEDIEYASDKGEFDTCISNKNKDVLKLIKKELKKYGYKTKIRWDNWSTYFLRVKW